MFNISPVLWQSVQLKQQITFYGLMGVWAPTDSEVCEAIRSHSLDDLNYFTMILLGSSTGVHVLFCFLLSLGSLINQVKGVFASFRVHTRGQWPHI